MANEKRPDLIDRKALGIGYCNPLVFDKTEYAHGWNSAIEILMNAPTVDAVEVVRCKECRFWEECESSLVGKVMCCTGQGFARIQKSPEDFCSYGERRTDA